MRTKCNRMDLIKNLNLWGNDLEDISVLQYMPNLEVLSLSVNAVTSLSDLRYCSKLSELYLRKNDIRDLAEVHNLRHLRQMRVLWLSDNPVATLPHYRQYVLHHVPGLTKLDSLDVTDEERRQAVEANLDGVQTSCGADLARPETPNAEIRGEMPEFSPPDRQRRSVDPESEVPLHDHSGRLAQPRGGQRRSQPQSPELPVDGLNRSNSGGISEENALLEQRLVDEDRAQRGGAQVRGKRPEPADMMFDGRSSLDGGSRQHGGIESSGEWGPSPTHAADRRPFRTHSQQIPNEVMVMDAPFPSRTHSQQISNEVIEGHSPALVRGEYSRGDFRDAPATRNSQARPVPTSPAAASPQYQQQQRRSVGAGSPVNGGVVAEREQAWSNDFAQERAYARSDPRAGLGPLNPAFAAGGSASRTPAPNESPSSQSWSEEGGASPAQPLSATDNILCAVLALIKELDSQGLELVRRAVEQRQEDGL